MGRIMLATSASTDEEYGGVYNDDTTNSFIFWGTYPNGRQAGTNVNTVVSVPCYKPKSNYTVSNAYVYDSSGSYTNILSSFDSLLVEENQIRVQFAFNSSYAGKLLRIDFT